MPAPLLKLLSHLFLPQLKYLHLLSCFSIILFISGCASTTQYVHFPETPHNTASDVVRIYVLRPSYIASSIKMEVYEDTILVGKLGPKSYLLWEVEEGLLKITGISENKDALVFSPKAGETYYIKQRSTMGIIYARNKLELMDEKKAKQVLERLKKPMIELAVNAITKPPQG